MKTEETVSTWWKMTKLDLSPSGEEELVAQFVHLISAAISNIHATSKLFSFLEQLITHIP